MRTRLYLALIAIFGALGIFVGTRARVWAQTEALKPQFIDLQKLLRSPQQFDKQAVVFTCRFAKCGDLFRQDSKLFTPAEYQNFVVWPVEAELWDKTARRHLLSSLYISKNNREAIAALESLSRYDTVKIAGYVEEVYANMPWISVEKIVPITGEQIDDEMLQDIAVGNHLLKTGDIEQAKLAFNKVTSRNAPAFIRQHIDDITADYAPADTIVQRPLENYMPLVEAARRSARNNDLTEAEKLYAEARKKSANNAWLYKEIGLFYEYENSMNGDKDKLEKALASYKQAESISDAPDADLQFLKARASFTLGKENGQFSAAELFLARCLQIAPDHALGRNLAAEITSAKLALTSEFSTLAANREQLDANRNEITLNRETIAKVKGTESSGEPANTVAAELFALGGAETFDRSELPVVDEFDKFLTADETKLLEPMREIEVAKLQSAALKKAIAKKNTPSAGNDLLTTLLPEMPSLNENDRAAANTSIASGISMTTPTIGKTEKIKPLTAADFAADEDIPEWAQ